MATLQALADQVGRLLDRQGVLEAKLEEAHEKIYWCEQATEAAQQSVDAMVSATCPTASRTFRSGGPR
jgi:predicted  nucleic acid-binding Zn-ribbon protein